MLKKKINFVDALFSNEGHYVCDIQKYNYLSEKYELHYFINGKLNKQNRAQLSNFIIHESLGNKSLLGQIKYLFNIKAMLTNKDFNFFMSIKYTSLFVFSLLTNFYAFFLLVHFFPTTRILFNKASLWFILKRSNGFMVLDKSVKDDVEGHIGKIGEIKVIHSRDLILPKNDNKSDNKLVVSFIGAINAYKDVSLLIELLNEKHYPGLEFHLYSKGITEYTNGILAINNILIKDEYFSPRDYSVYLKESDYIFLSYKPNYGVRFSGMVFDGLNNGCQLICNDNLSFNFVSQYNIGRLFSNKTELNQILLTLKNKKVEGKIYKHYSKEHRELIFNKIIERHFIEIN